MIQSDPERTDQSRQPQRLQGELPENTLKLLFERTDEAILILDRQVFVDCNEAAVKMMRCHSKEELLSLHPSEISPEYQPDGQTSYDKAGKIFAAAATNINQRFEWIHRRADGTLFPVEVLLTTFPRKLSKLQRPVIVRSSIPLTTPSSSTTCRPARF
jgi:PAS domain S-box-containing protein